MLCLAGPCRVQAGDGDAWCRCCVCKPQRGPFAFCWSQLNAGCAGRVCEVMSVRVRVCPPPVLCVCQPVKPMLWVCSAACAANERFVHKCFARLLWMHLTCPSAFAFFTPAVVVQAVCRCWRRARGRVFALDVLRLSSPRSDCGCRLHAPCVDTAAAQRWAWPACVLVRNQKRGALLAARISVCLVSPCVFADPQPAQHPEGECMALGWRGHFSCCLTEDTTG